MDKYKITPTAHSRSGALVARRLPVVVVGLHQVPAARGNVQTPNVVGLLSVEKKTSEKNGERYSTQIDRSRVTTAASPALVPAMIRYTGACTKNKDQKRNELNNPMNAHEQKTHQQVDGCDGVEGLSEGLVGLQRVAQEEAKGLNIAQDVSGYA